MPKEDAVSGDKAPVAKVRTRSSGQALAILDRRLQILLAMHEYNAELGRQYFDYRDRISASAMIVYAGLSSYIVSLNFSAISIYISVVMGILAHFCRFFVLKFYERSEYHHARCRVIRNNLDLEFAGEFLPINDILEKAKRHHSDYFFVRGRSSVRQAALSANTHDRWASLHSLFVFAAIGFLAIALVKQGFAINFVAVIDVFCRTFQWTP